MEREIFFMNPRVILRLHYGVTVSPSLQSLRHRFFNQSACSLMDYVATDWLSLMIQRLEQQPKYVKENGPLQATANLRPVTPKHL